MAALSLSDLFQKLWDDYASLNPQAQKIHSLLEARGERILNDHIAFRTFDDPRVHIDQFAKHLKNWGYDPVEGYDFPMKKLRALHFEHNDPQQPKIFVSELLLDEMSAGLQSQVKSLLDQLPENFTEDSSFLVAGRPWSLESSTYLELAEESEYAAWMSAFGFRANHFTVNVNALQSFETLAELNAFLKSEGFSLNTSGGEIKGGPEDYLEQSSTLAATHRVSFSDRSLSVPSCYYEFAKRYPLPSGKLFQGFVAQSADKIFESTDRQK